MSHTHVGQTYSQIIKDVIETSRVDFEEGGIEETVLSELKAGWERKLSMLGVANFPWDPKPEPAAVNNAPPQQIPGSDAQHIEPPNYAQAQLSPQPNAQPLPIQIVPPPGPEQNGNGAAVKREPGMASQPGPAIKHEPGQQSSPIPASVPTFAPGQVRGGPQVPIAAQRAAQALEGQFGPRAAASIHLLQSGMAQGQGANPPHGPRQGGPTPIPPPISAQQYRQQAANAAAMHQQRAQQEAAQASAANGVGKAQVDGPADDDAAAFEGVLMREGADGAATELGRVEIDRMLHDQIAANAKRMEGGGLMLPLRQATRRPGAAGKKNRVRGGGAAASAGGSAVAQMDGPMDEDIKDEDDEDDDADAINSDLDDPDEDLEDDEDDDDAMGHIMLCMWDKVQRVKNKWKCTLKDGVLTVNGKEYVFHKATGEYEW